MATRRQGKFDKHWNEFNTVFVIAVLLDPNYKIDVVEYALANIYGKQDASRHKTYFDSLYAIFDEYRSQGLHDSTHKINHA